jgi:hypothetical protein
MLLLRLRGQAKELPDPVPERPLRFLTPRSAVGRPLGSSAVPQREHLRRRGGTRSIRMLKLGASTSNPGSMSGGVVS